MLPKLNRLKKRKDFEGVFKQKKGYKENFLYLKAVKNNLKSSRFGFIVGKNFSNKAVIRNKTKRQLREAIRTNLPNIKSGFDIIIIVLPGFSENNFQEIEKIVKNLLHKAQIVSY